MEKTEERVGKRKICTGKKKKEKHRRTNVTEEQTDKERMRKVTDRNSQKEDRDIKRQGHAEK